MSEHGGGKGRGKLELGQHHLNLRPLDDGLVGERLGLC